MQRATLIRIALYFNPWTAYANPQRILGRGEAHPAADVRAARRIDDNVLPRCRSTSYDVPGGGRQDRLLVFGAETLDYSVGSADGPSD
jgi:hypothetical protein